MKLSLANIRITALALTLCVAVASCISDDGGTQPLNVSVVLTMPSEYLTANTSGRTVTMVGTEASYTAETDSQGVAYFTGIIPDVYSISTSWTVDAETYRTLTGLSILNETHVISGSLLSQLLAYDQTITLATSSSVKQSLLISKVYYAGSKDLNNKNYLAGQYFELFNNSEDTVDVAGLYFGLLESNSTPAYSLGLTPEYIYLKQVFRIPTTTTTRVAPGETIVITNSAIDHTEYGSYEKNLLTAEYEAKSTSRTNNPDTEGLDLMHAANSGISYMNLLAGGYSSLVLFSMTDDEWSALEQVYAYGKTSGVQYLKLPIKYVIDGVECAKLTANGVVVSDKRLYDAIDAGYVNISSVTGYNGQVVYRNISETTSDGRIVLMDTNNSSSDFSVSDNIALRAYE